MSYVEIYADDEGVPHFSLRVRRFDPGWNLSPGVAVQYRQGNVCLVGTRASLRNHASARPRGKVHLLVECEFAPAPISGE